MCFDLVFFHPGENRGKIVLKSNNRRSSSAKVSQYDLKKNKKRELGGGQWLEMVVGLGRGFGGRGRGLRGRLLL